MLPPRETGQPYRLHPDGSDGIVEITPDAWAVAPLRGLADRRRTRCPDGRWLYRHDDLPKQLATVSMLRRTRRRRADGQQPVAASYLVRPHNMYVPLYAVADSEKLPPLPPHRQAAWEAARRCTRCGITSETPHRKGRDGDRYCEDCQEPAAEDYWRRQRAADRRAAAEWAREVLVDSATVLIHASNTVPSTHVYGVTLTGKMLIEKKIWPGWRKDRDFLADAFPQEWTPQKIAEYADPTDADLIGQIRVALTGRRMIAWSDLDTFRQMMARAGGACIVPQVRRGDSVADRWSAYVGERSPRGSRSYRYNQHIKVQEPPSWEPAEIVAHMRQCLEQMAAYRG